MRPASVQDLLDIWDFIAADSRTTATAVVNRIQAEIQKLLSSPGLGHERGDGPIPHYRFWLVYSYLIVYHYDAKALTVVRVVHGARDIGSMFRTP